jgi:hypothetical protein
MIVHLGLESAVDELVLMARGVIAIFLRTANIQPLVDADHALELSHNTQLKEAPLEHQNKRRQEYVATIAERLRLLRRNILRSFILLASAAALSLFCSYALWTPSPAFRVWFGISSMFCFAWATLARLGWSGQSWRGNTVVERLDERIFKFLYWVGTFLGTLALA